MFGLSKASKAKKIYDSLSSLLTSIEGWTSDKKLPENMWVDPERGSGKKMQHRGVEGRPTPTRARLVQSE